MCVHLLLCKSRFKLLIYLEQKELAPSSGKVELVTKGESWWQGIKYDELGHLEMLSGDKLAWQRVSVAVHQLHKILSTQNNKGVCCYLQASSFVMSSIIYWIYFYPFITRVRMINNDFGCTNKQGLLKQGHVLSTNFVLLKKKHTKEDDKYRRRSPIQKLSPWPNKFSCITITWKPIIFSLSYFLS